MKRKEISPSEVTVLDQSSPSSSFSSKRRRMDRGETLILGREDVNRERQSMESIQTNIPEHAIHELHEQMQRVEQWDVSERRGRRAMLDTCRQSTHGILRLVHEHGVQLSGRHCHARDLLNGIARLMLQKFGEFVSWHNDDNRAEMSGSHGDDLVVQMIRVMERVIVTMISGDHDESIQQQMIHEIMNHLNSTRSELIRRQILTTVKNIYCEEKCKSLTVSQSDMLLSMSAKCLSDWDQGVRAQYIELLARLCGTGSSNRIQQVRTIQLLCQFSCADRDARVRSIALLAIVTLSNRGIPLVRQVGVIYQHVSLALKDDHVEVKIAALEVMYLLGSQFPSFKITIATEAASTGDTSLDTDDTPSTLVDDVFTKLCAMVRDQVVSIRTRALELIGSLHGVSERLQLQTFSKMHLYYTSKHIHGRKYHFEIQSDSERRRNRLIKSLREKYESELRYTSYAQIIGDDIGVKGEDGSQLREEESRIENEMNVENDSIDVIPQAEVLDDATDARMTTLRQIKYGGDNPDGDLNVDQFLESTTEGIEEGTTLSNDFLFSGVTGTFILSLEDEFREVRLACIDAISSIGGRAGREFADRSMQFLVDMFGDEIDTVRIKAIDCTIRLSREKRKAHGELQLLQEEQLTIALAILEDANPDVRYAIHRLLCNVRLPNANCLHAAVSALLQINMRKFMKEDKEAVFAALKNLGERHAPFVNILAERLLDRTEHRSMLQPERSVEDIFYTCVMIVVYNGYLHFPQIASILPPHMLCDHFPIFHSKHPTYFPKWPPAGTTNGMISYERTASYQGQQKREQQHQLVLDAFAETFGSIRSVFEQQQQQRQQESPSSGRPLRPATLTQVLKNASATRRELRQAASASSASSAYCDLFHFLDSFLELVMIYVRAMSSTSMNSHTRRTLFMQCFVKSYEMQFRYITTYQSSLPFITAELKLLRMMCLLQWWTSNDTARDGMIAVDGHDDDNREAIVSELQARVRDIQQHTPHYRTAESIPQQIHSILQRMTTGGQHVQQLFRELTERASIYLPSLMPLMSSCVDNNASTVVRTLGIRMLRSSILDPQPNTDHLGGRALTFLCGVPYDLSVRAHVRHWQSDESVEGLRVMIRLPNGQELTYPITRIRQLDIHTLSLAECDLELEIGEGWSEASQISVDVVREIELDRLDTGGPLLNLLFSSADVMTATESSKHKKRYVSLHHGFRSGVDLMVHPVVSR